jgi:hypothetical protein
MVLVQGFQIAMKPRVPFLHKHEIVHDHNFKWLELAGHAITSSNEPEVGQRSIHRKCHGLMCMTPIELQGISHKSF